MNVEQQAGQAVAHMRRATQAQLDSEVTELRCQAEVELQTAASRQAEARSAAAEAQRTQLAHSRQLARYQQRVGHVEALVEEHDGDVAEVHREEDDGLVELDDLVVREEREDQQAQDVVRAVAEQRPPGQGK